MDCGNATWTLEDPLQNLEILGPYAVTTGIRDSMVWGVAEGAIVQWTAMGEGKVDFAILPKTIRRAFAQTSPCNWKSFQVSSRAFPYLRTDFWGNYANARAHEFARFVALAKKGTPLEPFRASVDEDLAISEQQYQLDQLERSVQYCRKTLGLGLR